MKVPRRQLWLIGLITLELVGALLVLRWVLAPDDQLDQPQPPEDESTGAASGPRPVGFWMAGGAPLALDGAIREWVDQQQGQIAWTGVSTAQLTVDWQKDLGANLLAEIVLVPVVPFSSLRDDVTAAELERAWLGRARSSDTVPHILVATETAALLDSLFGPRDAGAAVTVVPAADLSESLWSRAGALAVVPFERLEPRLKALSVDGLLALDRDLDLKRYPLSARLWASGPRRLESALVNWFRERGLATNRRLDRLTVLDMTGVTALTRHLALKMDAQGDPGWPAREVADLLSAADLTHISNEVSFVPGCQPEADTTVFCARPEYLETLQLVGADLIELTGNHNLDFGARHALYSLDLYATAGMQTFGGGRNEAEASRPLLITHNGNRLAFIGYNQWGPHHAWAGEDSPGAARFTRQAAQDALTQVRSQVDLIFVSIQHTESYDPAPLVDQAADFRAMLEAGADVVTGSQAHRPQAVAFHDGGLILYGLGNLFFDQTWSEPTCQSLIACHYVYDGRLIATRLIPTLIGEDLKTRVARDEEADDILQAIFAASGW